MTDRVCVVRCPTWPIVSGCLDDDTPEAVWGLPMMIVHAGRVTSVSPEAASQGVFVGQKLRDAHSACPDVVRIGWSPERDQRMFDRFLHALSAAVPLVTVIEPGVVSLGATGLARYYGSEHESSRVLNEAVAPLGILQPLAIGYADTFFAADVASQCAVRDPLGVVSVPTGCDREFLAELPAVFLGDHDMVTLCAQLGIHTVGAFANLDRNQVAERFGHRGTLLHQLASGEDPRRHVPGDIPPLSDVVWRSDDPCESGDQLAFSILPDATHFINQLLEQRVVVHTLDITLVDDRGSQHRRRWSHPRYFTATEVAHRVRWQAEALATSHLDDDYSRGIVEVRLVAKNPQSAAGHEESLWGNAHRDATLHHTVSSLQGKLGHQAVARAVIRPGHHARDQQDTIAWGDHPAGDNTDRDTRWVGQLPSPHPATVFATPVPATLLDERGRPVTALPVGSGLSSPPHRLVSGKSTRLVSAWAGPWPVMHRWWETRTTGSVHRLQLLDESGMGWLVTTDQDASGWVIEARYD